MQEIFRFQESKKGTPDGGEDRLVITDDFVAVIDGATSKSGEKFDGKTGGAWVADTVQGIVSAMPRDKDAFNAVAMITAAVAKHVIGKYLPEANSPSFMGDRPNASIVMYSALRRQIWRVGDGHFAVDGQENWGKKEIDTVNSSVRAAYIQAALGRGMTSLDALKEKDIGREIIMSSLTAQPLLMNNPESEMGYGVIDGRSVPEKYIEIYDVPATVQKIILATDGVLCHLWSSDGKDPIRTMEKSLAIQQDYYREDPLLIGRHKSTKGLTQGAKWHDDVTIIEFSL